MNVFSVVYHLLGYIIEYNELRLKSQQIIQCLVSRSRFIEKGSCFGCLLIFFFHLSKRPEKLGSKKKEMQKQIFKIDTT